MVGMALLEGAAFLAGIAYLLEGSPAALGMMAAVVAIMLIRSPTAGRMQDWIVRQAEELERLRQEKTLT
jgi:hypothetical protein